jgi:2-polyprenyl-6-methoxyphenol hydroxylase-like FAD-dependent oxidoreductase
MKIIIAGGSIAGLSSALTLNCVGHEVLVFEKSKVPLRGRGGGVVVLRHMQRFLERHGQSFQGAISVPTRLRRRIGLDGTTMIEEPEQLSFPSWDAVYRSLCATLPLQQITYGQSVVGFAEQENGIEVLCEDGSHHFADVLLAADGGGSQLRAMLFPDHTPKFAGYIAWRGIVDESAFSPLDVDTLLNNFTMFRQTGHMFMTFLIPGLDGALEPGSRRFNWLWYRNEFDPILKQRHLTDAAGQLHHASIQPGELSPDSLAELCQLAEEQLARVLEQLVRKTTAPFLQSIFDALSPRFSVGRVALIGDAACTVRPHTGSGTSKAADDAVSIAQALAVDDATDVALKLADWSANQQDEVARMLKKGPELSALFGLGKLSA